MSCYRGTYGVLKAANPVDGTLATAATVGEITAYTLDETAETFECTSFGDNYREYGVSFKNWEASIECHWDPADTGQAEIVVGDTITIVIYPQNETVGDQEWYGSAIVVGATISASFDGLVSASLSLQGTGDLTKGVKA